LRALGVFALALSLSGLALALPALAGEVTVIRPSAFVGAETTYYIALDGRPLRDIETRQHVRFDVPNGRHTLAVRCPKALSSEYAETRIDDDFGAAPAFFVIEPKFDCVTLSRVDAQAAGSLIGNTRLRSDTTTTYSEGPVAEAAPFRITGTPAPAAQPLRADPAARDEVTALTSAWVEAFNSRDPARIAALYDPQAVLIGITAARPAVGAAAIAAYFADAPKQSMSLSRVALGEHSARSYGDIAIDSGLYNFFRVADGKATLTPARYTFVYRKRDGKWLIVEHHSSRVP
jgi:uncharacterized protein (TIGR02246 family)